MSNPYPYYIDIVTKRYFDGVDNKRLDQVLDCFHADAVLHEIGAESFFLFGHAQSHHFVYAL